MFKDFYGLYFSFSNLRTFKDFKDLWEPCWYPVQFPLPTRIHMGLYWRAVSSYATSVHHLICYVVSMFVRGGGGHVGADFIQLKVYRWAFKQ